MCNQLSLILCRFLFYLHWKFFSFPDTRAVTRQFPSAVILSNSLSDATNLVAWFQWEKCHDSCAKWILGISNYQTAPVSVLVFQLSSRRSYSSSCGHTQPVLSSIAGKTLGSDSGPDTSRKDTATKGRPLVLFLQAWNVVLQLRSIRHFSDGTVRINPIPAATVQPVIVILCIRHLH